MVCVGMSADFNLFHQIPSISSLTAGSPRAPPALAAQLRAFSVISSSLRAELSTSRNHSVGKVSAFADVCSNRSHPLTVCQRYCGRRRLLRHRPRPQCLFGRGSFIHASQALRPEKRGSPLPMGRTGTDFITLPLHCVRTRPAGKEVRLRLVLFDARFILSGGVVHYVPDTSSEGERRRETVTAGVPLLCTPSLADSQSGIAPLALRSICAGPIRSRDFSSSVAATGFPPTAPSPSVSSPFTAPIPTPPLRHSSPFRRPGSHVRRLLPLYPYSTVCARAGKTVISRIDRCTVRLLPRLSACLLTLRKTERTMLTHSPFRLPTSRAEDMRTLQGPCIREPHHTPEVRNKKYIYAIM